MTKGKYILYYTVMQEQYDDVIMYDDNIDNLVELAYDLYLYDNKIDVAITLTEHFERGAWDNLFELRGGKTVINSRTKKCSDFFHRMTKSFIVYGGDTWQEK